MAPSNTGAPPPYSMFGTGGRRQNEEWSSASSPGSRNLSVSPAPHTSAPYFHSSHASHGQHHPNLDGIGSYTHSGNGYHNGGHAPARNGEAPPFLAPINTASTSPTSPASPNVSRRSYQTPSSYDSVRTGGANTGSGMSAPPSLAPLSLYQGGSSISGGPGSAGGHQGGYQYHHPPPGGHRTAYASSNKSGTEEYASSTPTGAYQHHVAGESGGGLGPAYSSDRNDYGRGSGSNYGSYERSTASRVGSGGTAGQGAGAGDLANLVSLANIATSQPSLGYYSGSSTSNPNSASAAVGYANQQPGSASEYANSHSLSNVCV